MLNMFKRIRGDKINDDRLYLALDALLPHKEALEVHLKERLGELFNLEYDLLLYDVISTYFEGQARGNPLAQRGYPSTHYNPKRKQTPQLPRLNAMFSDMLLG